MAGQRGAGRLGAYCGAGAETSGVAHVSTPLAIPAGGVYVVQLEMDGDWTLDMQQ